MQQLHKIRPGILNREMFSMPVAILKKLHARHVLSLNRQVFLMLKFRHYLKEELKVTYYLIIILTVLSFMDFFEPYNAISWVSMLFYFFYNMAFGYYGARSLGKAIFVWIYTGGLALEFILSVLFIAGWYFWFKPVTNMFIVPFFVMFAIYKVFNTTIFLKHMNKQDKAGDVQQK